MFQTLFSLYTLTCIKHLHSTQTLFYNLIIITNNKNREPRLKTLSKVLSKVLIKFIILWLIPIRSCIELHLTFAIVRLLIIILYTLTQILLLQLNRWTKSTLEFLYSKVHDVAYSLVHICP